MDNLLIKKACREDIPRLKDVLDSATKKLLDKGVQQWEYPWDTETVAGFVEKNEFYIVLLGEKPRRCFGIRDFAGNHFVPDDKTGAYWYHLAVHPDYDRAGTGYKVCRWVQKWAQETGKKIYFDCWTGNRSLINYYTFMGFVPLGEFPEEDYFVMAFTTK